MMEILGGVERVVVARYHDIGLDLWEIAQFTFI